MINLNNYKRNLDKIIYNNGSNNLNSEFSIMTIFIEQICIEQNYDINKINEIENIIVNNISKLDVVDKKYLVMCIKNGFIKPIISHFMRNNVVESVILYNTMIEHLIQVTNTNEKFTKLSIEVTNTSIIKIITQIVKLKEQENDFSQMIEFIEIVNEDSENKEHYDILDKEIVINDSVNEIKYLFFEGLYQAYLRPLANACNDENVEKATHLYNCLVSHIINHYYPLNKDNYQRQKKNS